MRNKIAGFLLTAACAVLFTGCGKAVDSGKSASDKANATTSEQTVQPQTDDALAKDTALNNPATVYCLQEDGKFSMRRALDGTTEGICTLPNGVICEVWAHYKGECPAGAKDKKKAAATSTSEITVKSTTSTELGMTTTTTEETTIQDRKEPIDSGRASISLSVEQGEESGELITSWKTSSSAESGYIVMLSGVEQVSYPTKFSHVLKNPESHSFVWTGLTKDKTYYFRVCLADGETCGTYSEVVSAVAP